MRFENLTKEQKDHHVEMLFAPLNSAERLKDWVRAFLGLELPLEITDPDSTSSPLDAVWQVYNAFKTNSGDVNPGYILLSCREGMKTVSVAILETLLMLHFEIEIAHAAAIESQSSVGLGYISEFIAKIQPLMEHAGWIPDMANKRTIKFKTPKGKITYIKVLICTVKGMNSLHVNALFLDELDLADPKALKQARNIVGYSKGIFGITVYLSTRKYAFGNMNDAIESAQEKNYKIIKWNILDVTESCPPSRHKPEGEKEDRYVAKNLPLRSISKDEYSMLPEPERVKWDLIEQVYEGCVTCPLLAVCKKRLADKPPTATGGFYKPIVSVIQKFRDNDADTAEAELMCFSENAQILMGDGTQKNIKDISIGETVITHTGATKRVTETFKRPFSGSAYELNNFNWRGFTQTIVTSEHPFFVNGEKFKSISEVNLHKFDKWGGLKEKGDYFSLPINFESNKKYLKYEEVVNTQFTNKEGKVRISKSTGKWISDTYELTKDFGWIVGFYLAEGFVIKKTYHSNKINAGITFCTHIKETEYHKKVRTFANSLGFNTTEFKAKDNNGFTQDIQNSSLAELFIGMCGQYSDGKKISQILMNANLDFLSGILEGFYDGDGTKRVEPNKEITTTSYHLASQLFLIASRLGLCPRIKKSKKYKNHKQVYRVYYNNIDYIFSQNRTKFLNNNGYNQYRIDSKELTKSHFNGMVYNIEVEDDHSYIANGVAVHNCWRPGSEGLIYPRFISQVGKGNVIDYRTAYETIIGPTYNTITELTLLQAMHDAGIPFFAGVDWGYTHDFTIIIMAILPNGEVWVFDSFAAPGFEMEDMLRVAIPYRDKYRIQAWFADTAQPANCRTFTRNKMRCPNFKKDVMAGIESIRSKISTGDGKRLFKIISRPENKKLITAMVKHRWKLDGQGNITNEPDDARGIADLCDAMRYIGQNKFPIKGTQRPGMSSTAEINNHQNPTVTEQMRQEIASRIVGGSEPMTSDSTQKKGGLLWNF